MTSNLANNEIAQHALQLRREAQRATETYRKSERGNIVAESIADPFQDPPNGMGPRVGLKIGASLGVGLKIGASLGVGLKIGASPGVGLKIGASPVGNVGRGLIGKGIVNGCSVVRASEYRWRWCTGRVRVSSA